MSDLQKYQKYRLKKETTGSKVFKFVLWIILILFVIWIFKGCFSGGDDSDNVNEAVENTNAALNINGGDLKDTNESTEAGDTQASTFNLDNCTSAFSRGQNREEVALTFNAASKTDNTNTLLDILSSSNVPASFFFTGETIEENEGDVKSISDLGFPIYNLSYSYPHVAGIAAEELTKELEKTETAIKETTNKSTKPFFRPPYGEIDDNVFETVKEEGYCSVLWTVDAFDWQTDQTAEGAKNRVLDNLKDGAIIVMQVGNTIVNDFLQDLINEIKNKGYSIVDLPSLLTP